MPHTNFGIKLRSSYFSAKALCEPRSYEREACAIFFTMFFHVPKRLQFFSALRAIILMPYKSVIMYRIRAKSFGCDAARDYSRSVIPFCVDYECGAGVD